LEGTVNRSFILILLLLLAGSLTWYFIGSAFTGMLILGGAITGFVLALVTVFKPTSSHVTAPFYAIAEGLFLGGISALFENAYNGIVFQAIALTIGVFLCLLVAYRTGFIKATENFKLGIVAATGGIALIYLVSMIMGFFGTTIPYIHESGPIGIGFSAIVVIIAALNLVLDFDFIEKGVESGAPKYMEWYAAFGLLVTLVWLYMSILRLLAKLRD
jgi:uncharacterized YccA/Bax inhibitor family protein